MRMSEAKALMNQAAGYRVTFETREGGFLCSDFFPDRDEPPIAELEDAWTLAAEFAAVDPSRYVNVYVISARDFVPVNGYDARALNRYPPREATKAVAAVARQPRE